MKIIILEEMWEGIVFSWKKYFFMKNEKLEKTIEENR